MSCVLLSFRKKIATKGNFAVSANVAYNEVKLEGSDLYEDLVNVVKPAEAGGSTKSSSKQQQQPYAANKDTAM